MIPMRVPRSRLFHPLEFEFEVEVVVPPVVLITELVLEGDVLVAVDPAVVEDLAAVEVPVGAASATGPTAIVVVEIGRLGVVASSSESQVNIIAAIAPEYLALQRVLLPAPEYQSNKPAKFPHPMSLKSHALTLPLVHGVEGIMNDCNPVVTAQILRPRATFGLDALGFEQASSV